jgi:hypothetical protein
MDYPHDNGTITARCSVCHKDTGIVIGADRADWYLCEKCEDRPEVAKGSYLHGLTVGTRDINLKGQHTQGPWKALPTPYREDDTDCVSIFALCDAEKRPARAQGDTPQQAAANARLIAAAPELLAVAEREAAKDCEYTGSAGCDMLPEGVIRSVCTPCLARAAITKTQ